MFTDGAVRQLSGREFQSLGAATEKWRAEMLMLCEGTERKLCVDDRNERDWLYTGGSDEQGRPVDEYICSLSVVGLGPLQYVERNLLLLLPL